jgi:hypothetical protein
MYNLVSYWFNLQGLILKTKVMKTILITLGEFVTRLTNLKQVSEFREVQLLNKAYKSNLFSLRKQLDNILKFKDEQKYKVCPIIEEIIRRSKEKEIYEFFKANIIPNKKGEYQSYNILQFIRKNKESIQLNYLAK